MDVERNTRESWINLKFVFKLYIFKNLSFGRCDSCLLSATCKKSSNYHSHYDLVIWKKKIRLKMYEKFRWSIQNLILISYIFLLKINLYFVWKHICFEIVRPVYIPNCAYYWFNFLPDCGFKLSWKWKDINYRYRMSMIFRMYDVKFQNITMNFTIAIIHMGYSY